jgi:hypothetical protein
MAYRRQLLRVRGAAASCGPEEQSSREEKQTLLWLEGNKRETLPQRCSDEHIRMAVSVHVGRRRIPGRQAICGQSVGNGPHGTVTTLWH